MTRTISANLKAHYAQEVRTIARCWQIERKDSTILGFTDHDEDLLVGAITYQSMNSGQTSAVEANDNLSADTMDVQIILDSEGITETDVKAGLYERARLWIFEVNYESLGDGYVTLAYGFIGEVTLHDDYISAEFRSLSQILQTNIGRVYMPTCDAQLGDSRCTVNIATYSVSETVSAVTDRSEFTVSISNNSAYTNGRVIWTSGNNDTLEMEIKILATRCKLILPMPFNIEIGDTLTMQQGCRKTKAACQAFSNYVNFQGFNDLPGIDHMMQYPSLR